MFEHIADEESLTISNKGKTIYVMQNGNPDSMFKISFTKPMTKM